MPKNLSIYVPTLVVQVSAQVASRDENLDMGHVEIRGLSELAYGSWGNTRVTETAQAGSENTEIIPSAYSIKYKIRR